MTRRVYALLGRKDEPTDAVEEYCRYLGVALRAYEIDLQIRRVPWEIHGWREALHALRLQAANWRDSWILVQYTALAWSARGFPLKFLHVLRILNWAGARVAIVFHDVTPYSSSRLIDQLRRGIQMRTMRRALQLAERAILTVPLEKVSWFNFLQEKAVFIPVGPNFIIPETCSIDERISKVPTIGVFGITGGAAGARETEIIQSAIRYAAEHLGKLQLIVFGRQAELRESSLRKGFLNLPIELSIEGIVQPYQVVQKLFVCDVLLFVRGHISSRRSSAIAGIACGLPIVGFEGNETAPPITAAGVVLVAQSRQDELNAALVRVLSDNSYRAQLAAQSRTAFKFYFSWPSIAAKFARLLNAS